MKHLFVQTNILIKNKKQEQEYFEFVKNYSGVIDFDKIIALELKK